jgi:hypothetical protein
MVVQQQKPENGAVIPDIVVTPIGRSAILRWIGRVDDVTISNAIIREQNFLKFVHTDLFYGTRGTIAWFLLALSTKEEFTAHEKPDPYFIVGIDLN